MVAPELRFAGGAALEWPGDESVWAKLDGDVEKLVTIGRGIPRAVQKLQLFVDRRQFRPWLSVGTITDRTTAPYLEDLVARLDAFSGRSWTQETVSLMKNIPQEPDHPYEVVEELPLGEAEASGAGGGLGRLLCSCPGDRAVRRRIDRLSRHVEELLERHRPVHQVALGVRRVHVLAQVVELAGALDALDHDVEAERLAHHRDRAQQRAGALVAVDALGERQRRS